MRRIRGSVDHDGVKTDISLNAAQQSTSSQLNSQRPEQWNLFGSHNSLLESILNVSMLVSSNAFDRLAATAGM